MAATAVIQAGAASDWGWRWYVLVGYEGRDGGRSHFNVSEWGREKNHGEEAADLVRGGEMPPWFYLPAHPEAQLSEQDREALAAGLRATFGEGGHENDQDHPH